MLRPKGRSLTASQHFDLSCRNSSVQAATLAVRIACEKLHPNELPVNRWELVKTITDTILATAKRRPNTALKPLLEAALGHWADEERKLLAADKDVPLLYRHPAVGPVNVVHRYVQCAMCPAGGDHTSCVVIPHLTHCLRPQPAALCAADDDERLKAFSDFDSWVAGTEMFAGVYS
eukprot:gene3633-5651_t